MNINVIFVEVSCKMESSGQRNGKSPVELKSINDRMGKVSWFSLCKVYEPRHEKTCLRVFPTRPDTNRSAHIQKLAKVLKFRL